MIATKPFIQYTIPKSRTTQAFIHKNDIKQVWEDVSSFLLNCTTTKADSPVKIELSAYEPYKDDLHPEKAMKFIDELKKIFGEGETEPIAEGYPNETNWQLEKKDLQKAIDYLLIGRPWPRFTFGPVELLIIYDFWLVDPSTKKQLPGQELSSNLMVWLGRKCCSNTDLYFPFEKATEEFTSYVTTFEKHLPFVFEKKYLRTGRPNKDKTAHIYSKL
jgi:hypothetical protein